jgi:small subunit ribosomal protein S9
MTTAKKPAEKHAPTKAEGKTPAKKAAAPKKAVAKKVEGEAPEVNAELSKGGSFIPAVGRRKTAIARVRLIKNGKGTITINGRKFDDYFNTYEQRGIVKSALETIGQADAVDVSVKVQGGGLVGQAEAVRHGISRALLELNPTFRKSLKKLGYLTRDARKKERKKPGLKKARRSPQWSKR